MDKYFGEVMPCLHCGNKGLLSIVASYDDKFDDVIRDRGHIAHVTTHRSLYQVFQCLVCRRITVTSKDTCSAATDFEGCPIETRRVLYPSASLEPDDSLPNEVRSAYDAALKARHVDGAICAIALRRTLEMVCKDKGATRKNLAAKLKQLADKGILPPTIDSMAQLLKNVGNSAAHADDAEFPEETIVLLIQFTRAILEYVYVLPKQVAEIQERLQESVEAAEEVAAYIE